MQHQPNRARSLSRRTLLAGAAVALASPASAQTPAAIDEIDFSARIGALLAAMPADAVSRQGTFFYADLAGQLAAAGVERPAPDRATPDLPESYHQATAALPLASRAFVSGLDPRWYATFGFNPPALGQALMLVDGDSALAIFRGGFDPDGVRRALVASGYVEVRRERGDALAFGDDPELESTVGQLSLGTMSHAIVRDDLLVFASEESRIEDVLAVLAGNAPSMATRDRWTGLVALFSADTVGMIPVPARALAYWSGATPAAAAATLLDIAFGVRAGSLSEPVALGGEGTPQATPVGAPAVSARIEARLRYADADTAAREAEAIPRRWREGESTLTEEPFTELMELVDARVSPVDPRAVAIDFTSDATNRWSQMIFTNDLSPFIPAMG
jgi:hypothetical protein